MKKTAKTSEQTNRIACMFSFLRLTSSCEKFIKNTVKEETIRITVESKNKWHKIIGNTRNGHGF